MERFRGSVNGIASSFTKHFGGRDGFGGCSLNVGYSTGVKLVGVRLGQHGPCAKVTISSVMTGSQS